MSHACTVPGSFGPEDPAADAVRAALVEGLSRMRREEAGAYQFEPEGVHRFRAAVRRLRSVLRTYQPLLEASWLEATTIDLRWLARVLGEVRDLDVLEERLRQEVGAGDLAPETLEPLWSTVDARRTAARQAMGMCLNEERYRFLLARLDRASEQPPTGPEAVEPCRVVLPRLLGNAWRKLKRSGRPLQEDDSEEAHHRVRIQAKRARYAAEAIAPALEGKARVAVERFARHAMGIQDELGVLQDATVARRFLEEVRNRHRGDRRFRRAIRHLLDRQDREGAAVRHRFRRLWRGLDQRRNLRWREVP